MIVKCPNCSCKYVVPDDAIGTGKLVRCTVCSTTWQQLPVDLARIKRSKALNFIRWAFFYTCVLASLLTLCFAKDQLIKIWPPVEDFYAMISAGISGEFNKNDLITKDVSPIFIRRNGKLLLSLKGEILNKSSEVISVPNMVISLKNESEQDKKYEHVWTHELAYKKLLPNQKVIFETEPQPVPFCNLICEIKSSL